MLDTALIIDTDNQYYCRPIQVATIDVAMGHEWMQYFNSGRCHPWQPVHGITDSDVVDCEHDLSNLA